MKISIVGAGYVGYSLALLLSQKNLVSIYEINKDKINLINKNKSPIRDPLIKSLLSKKNIKLQATNDKLEAFKESEFAIIATPTDYNTDNNYFDTKSVEDSIKEILKANKNIFLSRIFKRR